MRKSKNIRTYAFQLHELPIKFFFIFPFFTSIVAFRAKCKIFSRHLQKPILKTEKGRFKGL